MAAAYLIGAQYFETCRQQLTVKTLFIVPIDAHYYKNYRMLKQYKNYNTCSDMFSFTQEPSSGSSPVLS
jgi:hypothetical protein